MAEHVDDPSCICLLLGIHVVYGGLETDFGTGTSS